MSIRARLLWFALLATLLPALMVLERFASERQATIRTDTTSLANFAQDSSRELNERVQGTAQLQFGLARATVLAQDDRKACSDFLAEVRDAHPQYTGILTILPNGRLFCDSLRTGRELNLTDRDYFRRALDAPAGIVLEAAFGRLTGRAVMQVAYPARDATGALRFVLLASLDLAKALNLDDRRVPGGRMVMLDDKGTVLAVFSGGDADLAKGASVVGTQLWQFASASHEAGTAELRMPDGRLYTWARADTSALAAAGVHILAGAPNDALLAAANRRFMRELGWMLLAAGLLFLIVWRLSERTIRRPISRMSDMAGRLHAGDLAARIEPPLPGGELGSLMAALNQAAESLQTQRADIERLNAQLLQSQRLEAIGQLTGGVAHDFNNLLTVVLGNADLLLEACAKDPDRRHMVQTIIDAAERGASLTKHLLAFARKQPLAPSDVDVNQRLAALDPMLRSSLGEHVEIELVRGAGLWWATVDATQLENALLNLCLNARDAMPAGGRLTIETANASLDTRYAEQHPEVKPGQYVMMAVSDTGSGIPAHVLSRVFEPFFTTKEKGKGTGLGLAMVYGFVKQSSGHISIYSEPGHGTTVKLYLPRASGTRGSQPELPVQGHVRGGFETVLVVEDDEPVRRLACLELRALGYDVLEAGRGSEALALLDSGCPVDLLFTDVVMPGGMSGRQLAEAALQRRPGLRVLYTSGYTENAIVHHGRLDPGVQLLPKPYRRDDLAKAVRQALGRDLGAGS